MNETLRRLDDNLVWAYEAIARRCPGARRLESRSFIAWQCDLAIAAGNLAFVPVLDPASALQLRNLLSKTPSAHVYALSADPPATGEILERSGFRLRYELRQMQAEGPPLCASMPLEHEESAADRAAAISLVSRTFYRGESEASRLEEAYGAATEFRWHGLRADRSSGSRWLAVAAVVDTPGARGIYSVCVDPAFRGVGLGSSLVSSLMQGAADEGRVAVLQADSRLREWYAGLGFRDCGAVRVYGLR